MKQLEQKELEVKDLNIKSNNYMIELGKKSQKLTQVNSSMFILQQQVEKMRNEVEEERASSAKEVSHLNAIIAEKNSYIEKLKHEGNFEKDREVFDSQIAFESTNFETILEEADLEHQIDKELKAGGPLAIRSGGCSGSNTPKSSNHLKLMQFPTTKSRKTSADIDPHKYSLNFSTQQNIQSIQSEHKSTQTAALPAEPVQPVAKSTENAEKLTSLSSQMSLLNNEKKALEVELRETKKLLDVCKRNIADRDQQIERLSDKIVDMSSENSTMFNELNDEYERVLALLKAQSKK